jgi:hypothetical protein
MFTRVETKRRLLAFLVAVLVVCAPLAVIDRAGFSGSKEAHLALEASRYDNLHDHVIRSSFIWGTCITAVAIGCYEPTLLLLAGKLKGEE